MNSYGDGNTYRGTVCKDSEVPTTITDGKTAYTAKHYIDMIEEELGRRMDG